MNTKTYYDKIFYISFAISVVLHLGFVCSSLFNRSYDIEAVAQVSTILGSVAAQLPFILIVVSLLIKNKTVGILGVILGLIMKAKSALNSIMIMTSAFNILPGYNTETVSNCVLNISSVIVFSLLLVMVCTKNKGVLFGIVAGAVNFVVCGIIWVQRIYLYGCNPVFLIYAISIVIDLLMYCALSFAWEDIFNKKELETE